MINAVKFQFDKAFDGGHQDMASRLQARFDQDIDQVRQESETIGFSKGHAQALLELDAKKAAGLASLEVNIVSILDTIETVQKQLIEQSAKSICDIVKKMTGLLNERFFVDRLTSVIESILPQLMETPRLVIRLPDYLISDVQLRFDTITALHGYAGKLIYVSLPELSSSETSIEWANGGLVLNHDDNLKTLDKLLEEFVAGLTRDPLTSTSIE